MANPFKFLAIGGIGGVLVGILIGALIVGGYMYTQTGGLPVPYDTNHSYIAGKFTVTTDQGTCTLKHISTAPAVFSPNVPLDVFVPHKTYTQSLWTFDTANDIDVFLHIWGPGDDGKTYLCEFGRSGSGAMTISGFGQTISWPVLGDWQATTMTGIGYSWLWVQLV
jgi:hypothetical protein